MVDFDLFYTDRIDLNCEYEKFDSNFMIRTHDTQNAGQTIQTYYTTASHYAHNKCVCIGAYV